MRHALIPGFVIVFVSTLSASAVVVDTVVIGDPGNAGALSGAGAGGFGPDRVCGAVDYVYEIGLFEITAGQYTEFLNAVAATDTYDLYDFAMGVPLEELNPCHIHQTGSPGSYTYYVDEGWADRPVNSVSWGDAARFVNWLHNGQPTGPQGPGTTETGSYTLNGAVLGNALMRVTREPHASWVIPTEDEWYKAAYYDRTTEAYYDYPTGSDTMPDNAVVDPDPGNNANYCTATPCRTTEVGEFEQSASPYGTFDQGGNVAEWIETVNLDHSRRGRRGGAFIFDGEALHAAQRVHERPEASLNYIGFRVANIRRIVCGDGVVDPPAEQCDDGNTIDGDGCQGDCTFPDVCGDGHLNPFTEECDDGNLADGDGCQADCTIPDLCGDGYVHPVSEECDDGNTVNGDGCSDTCMSEFPTTWYVDGANCDEPGTGTLENPFCAIQPAIDAAGEGDTVLVADDNYVGIGNVGLDFGGKAITVKSAHGPEHCQILPMSFEEGAFDFHGGEGPTSVLSGFTISACSEGPALTCRLGSSPRVENCVFRDNSASVNWDINWCEGGALHVTGQSAPEFVGCVFHGNSASCEVSDPRGGSYMEGYGGAAYVAGASPSFVNCLFYINVAAKKGGALYIVSGSAVSFENCAFGGNHSDVNGGALYVGNASASLLNCTFHGNGADGFGGAIYADDADFVLVNTILNSGGTVRFGDVEFTAEYSCVPAEYPGPGNIHGSPMLTPYSRLQPASPCIDAGDPDFLGAVGMLDLDGYRRVKCGRVDMGAYEFGAPGDVDCSGDVDLIDFAEWSSCGTDPRMGWDPTPLYDEACADFDQDADGDIDLVDLAALQRGFSGTE